MKPVVTSNAFFMILKQPMRMLTKIVLLVILCLSSPRLAAQEIENDKETRDLYPEIYANAEAGDKEAQLELGDIYNYELEDEKTAVKWYKKADKGGSNDAKFELAVLLSSVSPESSPDKENSINNEGGVKELLDQAREISEEKIPEIKKDSAVAKANTGKDLDQAQKALDEAVRRGERAGRNPRLTSKEKMRAMGNALDRAAKALEQAAQKAGERAQAAKDPAQQAAAKKAQAAAQAAAQKAQQMVQQARNQKGATDQDVKNAVESARAMAEQEVPKIQKDAQQAKAAAANEELKKARESLKAAAQKGEQAMKNPAMNPEEKMQAMSEDLARAAKSLDQAAQKAGERAQAAKDPGQKAAAEKAQAAAKAAAQKAQQMAQKGQSGQQQAAGNQKEAGSAGSGDNNPVEAYMWAYVAREQAKTKKQKAVYYRANMHLNRIEKELSAAELKQAETKAKEILSKL